MSEGSEPTVFDILNQQYLLKQQQMGIDPSMSLVEQFIQKDRWEKQQRGIDPDADLFEQVSQMYQRNNNMDDTDETHPVQEIKRLPKEPIEPDPVALAENAKYEQFLADFMNYGRNLADDKRADPFEQLRQTPSRKRGWDHDR